MKHFRPIRTLSLFIPFLVSGCGGSHISTTPTKNRGTASITVKWPEAARFIPVSANSLKVVIQVDPESFDTTGPKIFGTAVLNRPSGGGTSTAPFASLPYGDLTVIVTAYSEANAAGVAQASGTGALSVVPGTRAAIDIAPGSTVASIRTIPSLFGLQIGETRTVRVGAANAANAIVPLATTDGTRGEAVTWLSSDESIAKIEGTGPTVTLRAIANGNAGLTATFTTTDPVLTLGASALVEVSASPIASYPGSALLDDAFPTPRGNAGAERRGAGPVPVGTVGTALNVGSAVSPLFPKVVDASGNLYAANGTTLRAFDPSGDPLWNAPVTNLGRIFDLALTKDGRLHVVGDAGLNTLVAATGASAGLPAFTQGGLATAVTAAPNGDLIYTARNAVYALRPTDHALRWSSPGSGDTAVGADGKVVVRSGNAILVIDGATGERLREIPLPVETYSSYGIAIRNGVVLASSNGVLFALDASTGAERWHSTVGTGISKFAFTSDGGAVLACGDVVTAFDASGNVRSGWPQIVTGTQSISVGSGDVVYLTSQGTGTSGYDVKMTAFGIDGVLKSGFPATVAFVNAGAPFASRPVNTPAISSTGVVYVGLATGVVVPVR